MFATGAVLSAWLAWSQRSQSENPAVVLLIVWITAGVSHMMADDVRSAAKIAAFGSVALYTLAAVFMGVVNKMLLAGMAGCVLSLVMGMLVSIYREPGDDA